MSRESNTVYVGSKPPMSYVLAVITNFQSSDTNEVILKTRGRAITSAVDAAEITRRRFMKDLKVGNISIGTEEMQQEDGGTRNVSTMEITLNRNIIEKESEKIDQKTKPAAQISPVELTSIAGIGGKRAEKLKSHGVDSVQTLVNSNKKELAKELQISEKRVTKWIDEAEKTLNSN